MAAFNIIKNLFLKNAGKSYIGENISICSHLISCAETANNKKLHNEVVVAALLHDIGHFLAKDNSNGYGVSDHARLGGAFLRGLGFKERISTAVELHADAKRFLVSKNPEYYYDLSPASKITFELQGGYMTQDENLDFMDNLYYSDAIKIRECDDQSKSIDMSKKFILENLYKYKMLINEYSKTSSIVTIV